MDEARTNTAVLMDLLDRWQKGSINFNVLRRDLSGMASNADRAEEKLEQAEAEMKRLNGIIDKLKGSHSKGFLEAWDVQGEKLEQAEAERDGLAEHIKGSLYGMTNAEENEWIDALLKERIDEDE